MRPLLAHAGSAMFGFGTLWLISELIAELHRLDEMLADTRLRVGHLEGYVDRLKPATDYWWLRRQ